MRKYSAPIVVINNAIRTTRLDMAREITAFIHPKETYRVNYIVSIIRRNFD